MIFQFQRTGVNLLTLSPVLFLEPPEAQVTRECVAPILHHKTVIWFVRTHLPSSGLQQPECDRKHYWKFSHMAFSSSGELPLAGRRLKPGKTARFQPVLRIKIPFSFPDCIYLWRGHFHQMDQELFPSGSIWRCPCWLWEIAAAGAPGWWKQGLSEM